MTRHLILWMLLLCHALTVTAQEEPIGNDNTMSLTPVDSSSTDCNPADSLLPTLCLGTDTLAEGLPWPQNVQLALKELLDDKLLETSQMAMQMNHVA